MLTPVLILLIGLTPSLFSLWILRQANTRVQARLQLAVNSVSMRGLPTFRLNPDLHYVEGVGYMIGDLTCQFNARSSYIRCAVNPIGPCQECSHYQSRLFTDEL